MTRRDALILLLRSLDDLTYEPPTWTNQLVQRQSRPGEGPSERIDCGTCSGQGEIRRRGIPTACPNPYCKAGKVMVDAYTLRPISTDVQFVQRVKAIRCDACGGQGAHPNGRRCTAPGCNGSGWVEQPLSRLLAVRIRLSLDATEYGFGDPVLAALERREKAGDYENLGLALAALRLEHRPRYRLVVGTYVLAQQEPEDLQDEFRVSLRAGLNYLLDLMPEEIRVPSWAAKNERRRRENLRKRMKEVAA